MTVQILGLGVLFQYPLGPMGPARIYRQYMLATDDGRIEKIGEWDDPETPDGEYEMTEEQYNKVVEAGLKNEGYEEDDYGW